VWTAPLACVTPEAINIESGGLGWRTHAVSISEKVSQRYGKQAPRVLIDRYRRRRLQRKDRVGHALVLPNGPENGPSKCYDEDPMDTSKAANVLLPGGESRSTQGTDQGYGLSRTETRKRSAQPPMPKVDRQLQSDKISE
jgi:hypothetical protein